jgi:hypothetical protein
MLLLFKLSIMTRSLTFIFLILIIIPYNIAGQDSEDKGLRPGELSLSIKSINFIKDNEYFNNISASDFYLVSSLPGWVDKSVWTEGYTLIGFFFQPELVYIPSEKITFRAGTHLLKYSGLKKFSQIKPLLSATIKVMDHTSLTIGSLSGSNRHQLFDPHFNSERHYSDYSEDGFQVITSTDHIFSDNWLSWENYISRGDSAREVFTTGESFRYTFSPLLDILHFEVPLQFQFKHFGGQVSNFPEHIETYFNFAGGIRTNIDIGRKRYGQAGIEYLRFFNSEFPRKPPSGITHGQASWIKLDYTYKVIYIGVSYWKAHNFFAPNGNPIYGSVIDTRSDYVIPDRSIITNTLYLTFLPEPYVELFLGVETYYDTCLKKTDTAITIHLSLDKLFTLATLKH